MANAIAGRILNIITALADPKSVAAWGSTQFATDPLPLIIGIAFWGTIGLIAGWIGIYLATRYTLENTHIETIIYAIKKPMRYALITSGGFAVLGNLALPAFAVFFWISSSVIKQSYSDAGLLAAMTIYGANGFISLVGSIALPIALAAGSFLAAKENDLGIAEGAIIGAICGMASAVLGGVLNGILPIITNSFLSFGATITAQSNLSPTIGLLGIAFWSLIGLLLGGAGAFIAKRK